MSDLLLDDEETNIDSEIDSLLTVDSNDAVDLEAFEPQKEHWSIQRESLLALLQLVGTLPAKSVIFMALWKEGPNLRFHANNKDAVIDGNLPLLNDNPYETDKCYFLDSKVLLAFLQNYTQFAFTFDEKGNIFFETPYSLAQLEMFNLSKADMIIDLSSEKPTWQPYPLTRAQTNVFKALFSFAVSLNDNKVLINPESVSANFTLYQHQVKVKTDVPETVVIRRMDLGTIYNLTNADLEFGYTTTRLFFKTADTQVSFLRMNFNASDYHYPETYALGEKVGEFQADIKALRKALKLTHFLSSNVIFFRNDAGKVYLYANDNTRFYVGSGILDSEFSLSTELFTKLVATIDPAELFVDVKVTEKGIDIQIEKDIPVNYSMSRTTVGQQKRADKLQKKQENRVVRKAALAEKGKLTENSAEAVNSVDELLGDL